MTESDAASRAWLVAIRRDHRCACARCDPSLALDGIRRAPQHIGVRFWSDDPKAEILVDGRVIDGVFEAILGEEGLVWAYRETPPSAGYHPCLTCCDAAERADLLSPDGYRLQRAADGTDEQVPFEICSLKLIGRVEIRRAARPADGE
jgi:hypothetical protein